MVKVKFFTRTKVRRYGGSLYFLIPKKLAKKLRASVGQEFLVFLAEDGRVILEPAEREEELP